MLILNLMPAHKKAELQLRKIYLIVKKVMSVTLIFTIVVAIIILGAKLTLTNILEDTILNTSSIQVNKSSYENEFKMMNKNILEAKQIYEKFIPYDELLLEINSLIPTNIKLEYLSLDIETKKASFKGKAIERHDLLNFKDTLNNSSRFKNIDLPINNLLEKSNLEFTINADLII